MNISSLDLGIIGVYLLGIFLLGIILSRKETSEDYFVNSRKTRFWLLIFTSISTSIGAASFIGIIGSAYDTGISLGISFMILSALGWFIMAWLAPRIKQWADENRAHTMGDFFASKFSERTGKIAGIVIILAGFVGIATQFVAFAKLVEIAVNINFLVALLITAFITISYTVLAGIKGDFYSDAVQFFVMLPIFVFLLVKGLSLVGMRNLFSLPDGHLDLYNYAGPVFFYGAVILGFFLIISAMEIWQRIFSSYGPKTARKAFFAVGVLKVVAVGACIILGLLAFKIVPGVDKDVSLFALVIETLPVGMIGVGFASILAVLMSTVDSSIMVVSATFTKDFFLKKGERNEKKMLRVGRWASLVFGTAGLAVAVFVPDVLRLAVSAAQMISILAPAIISVLILKKSNEKGAFWGILGGFVALVVALPFIPDFAFLPGFIVAILAMIFFSLKEALLEKKLKIRGSD